MTAAVALQYTERASEQQIVEILELLLQSPIPASYQEALINSVHSLDSEQADAILLDLTRLLFHEDRCAQAKEAWTATWARIAERIRNRMVEELGTIEREFERILRRREPHVG
jgi:hypothetical protein